MKLTIKILYIILPVLLTLWIFAGCKQEEKAPDTAYRAYFVYTDSGVRAYEVSSDGAKKDTLIASTEPSDGSDIGTAGNGFVLQGTTVTITSSTNGHSCRFYFTGTCSNGNIFVEKNGSSDIELELQGLDLTEPDKGSCPLWIKGEDTVVTLKAAEGTTNVLTDAAHLDAEGKAMSPKACINASGNLTISGKGQLSVNGNNKNGIKSDEKIQIESGITLNIVSVGNGIAADKEICLASGFAGSLNITSAGKGLCGSYSKDDLLANEIWEDYDNIFIYGGTVNIDSVDDAIHSDRNITVAGGILNIKTGDDGLHADENITIGTSDGAPEPTINITECFEGVEGLVVDVYSGDIDIVSSDDGFNAANPENKESDQAVIDQPVPGGENTPGAEGEMPSWPDGGFMPGGEVESDDSCNINIYGGDIYVLSGKDSFDSNGNITISGGNCVLYASSGKATMTSDGLDAGGKIIFTPNGGTVFATSPSGRMQPTPEEGGQTYIMGTLDCEKDVKVSVDDGGTLKVYNMDCSDGFILYTSPTYTGGAVINTSSGTELVIKTAE